MPRISPFKVILDPGEKVPLKSWRKNIRNHNVMWSGPKLFFLLPRVIAMKKFLQELIPQDRLLANGEIGFIMMVW